LGKQQSNFAPLPSIVRKKTFFFARFVSRVRNRKDRGGSIMYRTKVSMCHVIWAKGIFSTFAKGFLLHKLLLKVNYSPLRVKKSRSHDMGLYPPPLRSRMSVSQRAPSLSLLHAIIYELSCNSTGERDVGIDQRQSTLDCRYLNPIMWQFEKENVPTKLFFLKLFCEFVTFFQLPTSRDPHHSTILLTNNFIIDSKKFVKIKQN
jgi:hypothetical protein